MNMVEVKISFNDGQSIVKEMFFSLSDEDKICRKKRIQNKIMEEKRITNSEIYEAIADFSFDLFRVFDDKYKAAPIKIQKLLFISELAYVFKYKGSIFPNDVVFESNACGFKIPTMTKYINNFISNGELDNESIVLTPNETQEIDELKRLYVAKGVICENILNVITKTVIEFGKYYPVDLGEALNDFKKNSQNSFFKQQPPFEFSILEFQTLLNNINNLEGNNSIADFIINYD